MKTTHRSTLTALLLVAPALVLGCSGQVSPTESGRARATLRRAQSCDDLLASLQADATAKLNARVDQEIAWLRQGYYGYGYAGGGPVRGGAAENGDGSLGTPATPGDATGGGATSYSETNTQVAGVDEADIVKTDGKRLYVLHGQSFVVLDAWPAASLALGSSVAIEGQPGEMFVDGERAVVFSAVDGNPVYAAAGVTPRSPYAEYGAYATPAVDAAGGTAAGGTGGLGAPDQPGTPTVYAPLTKITVLSLGGGAPAVVAEHWFEGDYLSSRRVGAKVRAVLNGGEHGPELPYYPAIDATTTPTADAMIAAWESLRQTGLGKIAASTVQDYLPYRFTREAAGIAAATPACGDFYVPTPGTTQAGLVQIASLDTTAPQVVHGVSIVGRADTVYANASTLVLAAAAWTDAYVTMDTTPGAAMAVAPASYTHLHTFDLASAPDEPAYVASGTVVGSVQNQFSLDVEGDVLRVATTEDRLIFGGPGEVGVGGTDPGGSTGSGGAATGGGSTTEPAPTDPVPPSARPADVAPSIPSRVNHVFALRATGDALSVVGDVGELAPNERIYATRFVGSRGYIVTYKQVDPLFVVDLSEPTQLAVLGELTIPGFSEYMHPLDDAHLLTIGQDTVDVGGGTTRNGLALQIFDVSDAAHPALVHKYAYGDPGGSSTASYDHKAFTYYPERKLLAFPYSSWSTGSTYGVTSTLELFSVDTVDGFAKRGSLDHSAFFADATTGYCGGYYGVDVRRGVFMDDFVYSVSYGGVLAHDTRDLAAPVGSVALPGPVGDPSMCAPGGIDDGMKGL